MSKIDQIYHHLDLIIGIQNFLQHTHLGFIMFEAKFEVDQAKISAKYTFRQYHGHTGRNMRLIMAPSASYTHTTYHVWGKI